MHNLWLDKRRWWIGCNRRGPEKNHLSSGSMMKQNASFSLGPLFVYLSTILQRSHPNLFASALTSSRQFLNEIARNPVNRLLSHGGTLTTFKLNSTWLCKNLEMCVHVTAVKHGYWCQGLLVNSHCHRTWVDSTWFPLVISSYSTCSARKAVFNRDRIVRW